MAKNEYYYHIRNHRRERHKTGEHGRKPAPEMRSGAPFVLLSLRRLHEVRQQAECRTLKPFLAFRPFPHQQHGNTATRPIIKKPTKHLKRRPCRLGPYELTNCVSSLLVQSHQELTTGLQTSHHPTSQLKQRPRRLDLGMLLVLISFYAN